MAASGKLPHGREKIWFGFLFLIELVEGFRECGASRRRWFTSQLGEIAESLNHGVVLTLIQQVMLETCRGP
jgi:hypothetical protein